MNTYAQTTIVPEVLTVAEAAAEMRVSAQTVRRWIRNDSLDYVLLPSGRRLVPIAALSRMQRLAPRAQPGQLKHAQRGHRP